MSEDDTALTAADWDAATYDRVADPMTRWGATVLARLALRGDETVVDAGCGSGRVTEMLLQRLPAGRVIGIDASATMLAEAERRLEPAGDRVRLLHADLLELTPALLGGTIADAVLSTATFHWIADHERLFANLHAVLRPGGQLVAQCGAEANIARLLATVRALGVERPGRWNYASVDDTRRRLAAAGFRDIEVWSHPEPTRFDSADALAEYLETICLRQSVGALPVPERERVLRGVVAAMPDMTIDYVRLNMTARRDA